MKLEGLIQFVKFGIVGVTNTAVDWIVFYLLIHTFLPNEIHAKIISFFVAVLNSYLWNTIWTFKKEYGKAVGTKSLASHKRTIFIKFLVVSLVGWGINVGAYSWATSNIDIAIFSKQLLPLVIASGAAIVWNFFINKLWTFKKS